MSNVFQQMPDKSTSISASGTSASASVPANAPQIRLYNAGTVAVFVRWGIGAQTAVATDMAIAPGTVECFSKGMADTVAAITGGTAATLYITPGEGA